MQRRLVDWNRNALRTYYCMLDYVISIYIEVRLHLVTVQGESWWSDYRLNTRIEFRV